MKEPVIAQNMSQLREGSLNLNLGRPAYPKCKSDVLDNLLGIRTYPSSLMLDFPLAWGQMLAQHLSPEASLP